MTKLKTLEENKIQALGLYDVSSEKMSNGVECPGCGKELVDSDGIALTTVPSQYKVHCANNYCDFTGLRY